MYLLVINPLVSDIIWSVLLAVMAILEYRSRTSTYIWFAIGAMMSLLFSHYGTTTFNLQIVTFFVFSFGSLLFIRQFVKKLFVMIMYHINKKSVIGKNVIVTKEKGASKHIKGKLNGMVWTLSYDNDLDFKRGDVGVIESIDGSKLIIRKHGFFHC